MIGARRKSTRLPLQSPAVVAILTVAIALGIGVVDYLTGIEISVSILYLVPVAVGVWYGDRRLGLCLAWLGAVVWFAADRAAGASYSHPLIPVWNATVRLGFFLVTAILLHAIKRHAAELEAEVTRQRGALGAEAAQRAELERSLAEVAAQEQGRIARDLHDGLGQYLAGLAFRARMLADDLEAGGHSLAPRASHLVDLVNHATAQVRQLNRVLHPAALETHGLGAALEVLREDILNLCQIDIKLTVPSALPSLDTLQRTTLFRIAQEAVNNALRHGRTRSIRIVVENHPAQLRLAVSDDGIGIGPGAGLDAGDGLQIMRHRAELIGATLTVQSSPARGCRVECLLPLGHLPIRDTPALQHQTDPAPASLSR